MIKNALDLLTHFRHLWVAPHRRHVKEVFWIASGQFGVMLASLCTLKIFTSILPPAEYGRLNLLLVAMILPSWVLFAPISQATMRWYAPQREKSALGDLLYTALAAYAAITLIAIAACLIALKAGFLDELKLSRLTLALFAGLILTEGWIALGLSIAGAARQRARVAITTLAMSWLRLAFALVGISLYGPSLEVILTGYILGSLALCWYALGPLVRELRAAAVRLFRGSLLKAMLIYGAPFAVWSSFAWAQQYLDRYVVDVFLGAAVAGTYIAAIQVASLPFTLGGALITQFVTPIIYERAGDGTDAARVARTKSFLFNVVGAFSLIGVVVVAIYAVAGPWIMTLLTHGGYLVPTSLLVILATGALLSAAAQQLTLLILARNRSGLLLVAKVLPALLGLPLIVILTAMFDLFGASVGYMLNGIVFLLTVLTLISRLTLTTKSVSW